MLQTPSIRFQIELLTSEGNKLLSAAVESGSPIAFARAIQEFSSSYKFALLLNSKDGTEELCAFNLGAAHVAGGDTSRGIALLQTVLEQGRWSKEIGQDSSTSFLGDVYFNLAAGHEKQSDTKNALKYYTSALLQYDEKMDAKKMCETYLKIASIFNARKEFSEARRNFDLAAKLYWKVGDSGNALVARTCQAEAGVLDRTYSQDECLRLLDSCCNDCGELKDNSLQAKILCEVGFLYSRLHSLERALMCFEKSVKLCKKPSSSRRRALALQNAGAILNTMGYFEESVSRHTLAAQLHGTLKNRNAQGQSFCNLGFARSQLGQYEEAWEAYLHALKAFEDTDDKKGQWQCHEGLGAIQFSYGRHDKAVKHFNMALACLTIGHNDEARSRVINKLSNALKMESSKVATDSTLAIENGQNAEMRTSTPAQEPTSLYLTGNTSIHQPKSPLKRPKSRKRRRTLERGRRAYSDETGRPVLHIARGISNITQYSNPYAESQTSFVLNDSTSSEDDKSDDSLSDVPSFSSGSKSKQDEMKRIDSLKKKHLRKAFHASTLPIHSVSDTRNADLPDGGSHDISSQSKETEEKTPKMNSSAENVAEIYRRQLTKIDEDASEVEEDLTSVTSTSDSSSSSESSDGEKLGSTTPVPSQNKPRGPAPSTNNEAPEGQMIPPANIYSSIVRAEDTTKTKTLHPTEVIYDEVPDNASQDGSDLEQNIPSLLTAHGPRRNETAAEESSKPAASHETSTVSTLDPPVSHAVSSEPVEIPPELPQHYSSSEGKKKGRKEKNKDSKACIVM